MTLAELYDLRTRHLTHDLPFIVEQARQGGPRILELGCGTGRVLRALHEAGFSPTGIDIWADAVSLARRRCPELRIEVGDMRTFDLAARFDLVLVAFNTFDLLLCLEDRIATLDRVREHCDAGAKLYIDLEPLVLDPSTLRELDPPRPIRTLADPGGGEIDVFVSARRELMLRRTEVTMEYRWRSGARLVDHYSVSPVTADELWLLLRCCGFTVLEWVGDYAGTPYDPSRHHRLVVVASVTAAGERRGTTNRGRRQ
jgi:SAM-dependent methyltransferase